MVYSIPIINKNLACPHLSKFLPICGDKTQTSSTKQSKRSEDRSPHVILTDLDCLPLADVNQLGHIFRKAQELQVTRGDMATVNIPCVGICLKVQVLSHSFMWMK